MFLIRTILVTLWCCSILGPAFVPKYRENLRRRIHGSRARPVHVFVDGESRQLRRTGSNMLKSIFQRRSSRELISTENRSVGMARISRNDRYYEDKQNRENRHTLVERYSAFTGRRSTVDHSFVEATPSKTQNLGSWADPPSSLG